MSLACVTRIISGGQVGADRAGLDFALENGIDCGGWCPNGRRAEDGVIPAHYPVRELPSPAYAVRTKRNVEDSDATVILTTNPPGAGSAATIRHCLDLEKCYLVLTQEVTVDHAAYQLLNFVRRNDTKTLNVAGSRKPEFYHWTLMVLKRATAIANERSLGEDPKRFLQEVRSGIGPSETAPNAEWIDFKDDQGLGCKVQCHNAERLYLIPEGGRLALNQGQAKRLAHTLERWASAGNLGKGVGAPEY